MIVLGLLLLQFFDIRSVMAVCVQSCGTIAINYPFGTNNSCSLPGFELKCDQRYQPPKLFLGNSSVEVLNIFYSNSTILVRTKVVSTIQLNYNDTWSDLPTNGPYVLSTTRNKFVAVGCGVLAQLSSLQQPQQVVSACVSVCASQASLPTDGSCTGIGCCKSSIPMNLSSFGFQLTSIDQMPLFLKNASNKAFIVEETWLDTNISVMESWHSNINDSQSLVVPVLLEWNIIGQSCANAKGKSDNECISENSVCLNNNNGTGYRCKCSDGFEGNPYVKDGCQDIDECSQKEMYPCYGVCENSKGSYNCYCKNGKSSPDQKKEQCVTSNDRDWLPVTGVLTIVGVGIFVCLLSLPIAIIMLLYKLKARRLKKLKDKFFKENRGFLLQQLISSNKDIAERLKIFSLEDLEKATNNFDPTRIVGSGGHGTVYKGILSDQRVAAIKKSKIKVQKETQEFINEVIILSQINHRNVVKLYGCCLESEVPMLVYEFISNGALSNRLYNDINRSLPWQDRTRIALETARALAYLHTAASISVFHRDIKTANILLDDSLTAKLSDFGASRSVPLTETGVTTVIQGTYGYLDPEYYYTGRLTEKSDVYSYGVILVELLTKLPAGSKFRPDGCSLAAHFMTIMREKRLFEILDLQVVEEGKGSDIKAVAALAEACLNIKGDERPTMKEVEMKLENLLGLKKRSSKRSEHLSTPRRLYENQELLRMISTEESSSSEHMTRQYSLEEEYLVENYPR